MITDGFISARLDEMEIVETKKYEKALETSWQVTNQIGELLENQGKGSLLHELGKANSSWHNIELRAAYKQGIKDFYEFFSILPSHNIYSKKRI